MKYISEVNEQGLFDLVGLYVGDTFRRLMALERYENCIYMCVEIEYDGELYNEGYNLYDYAIESLDYNYNDEANSEVLSNYRELMLGWFGNDYAIDYLFWY